MFEKRQNKNTINSTQQPLLRRHRPDYLLILFMGILSALGLVVLYAISPARVEQINLSGGALAQNHFMEKQLLYLLIGLIAFSITATISLKFWHKIREKLLWVSLGASLLLSILGALSIPLAQCTNGACRWYSLGPLGFQPAELLKFGLLIFLAGFLAHRILTKQINNVGSTLVPVGVLLVVSLLLVVGFQKDMGTGIAIIGITACMLFIAGIKTRYFLVGVGILAMLVVGMIVVEPHRIERITTFFAPQVNTDTASYHITQANIAIGSGGLIGKGLANSIQAYGYLPEAANDSIFAIMGEKFGLVGLIAILAIFMGLLYRLLKTMDNVADPYFRMLVAGVFGWIATQSIVNIGAMLGVFPLTGVTLPFLSFGGSSLLFVMAALGLAYQVSRYTSHGNIEHAKSDLPSVATRRRMASNYKSNGRLY